MKRIFLSAILVITILSILVIPAFAWGPTTTYTITASAGVGGTITPSGEVEVDKWDSQTFTITTNAGWYISGVTIDGTPQVVEFYRMYDTYTFYCVHSDHTISVTFGCLIGTQGEQGVQGVQGVQGPIGFPGKNGLDGKDGTDGVDGINGTDGETGPRGWTGVQGEKGDKGDTGEQGIQGEKGEQGIQGVKGDKGDVGEQGLQGALGPIGQPGIQGLTGAQGEAGEKGDTGDKGDTGEQGVQGEQGLQGVQGEKGEDGITVDNVRADVPMDAQFLAALAALMLSIISLFVAAALYTRRKVD